MWQIQDMRLKKAEGIIGVYNSSLKGDGISEYVTLENNRIILNENSFNVTGMNYGFNSSFVYIDDSNVTHKTGIYTNQFLYQINQVGDEEKRVLRDGYAGSDGYTSLR